MDTTLGTDFTDAAFVFIAVVLLVAVCRWVFGSQGVRNIVPRPDYGLLSPAARFADAAEAERALRELAEIGIRGTVAPAGKGFDAKGIPWPAQSHMVLVFPADAERATELITTRPL